MRIALQHANVGAWDVAESVYTNLGQQQLPLRQPERLEFARALCELGKAIPQHAQQVLSAITLWQRQSQSAEPSDSQIALQFGNAPAMMSDLSSGGMGDAETGAESEDMMGMSEMEMDMGLAMGVRLQLRRLHRSIRLMICLERRPLQRAGSTRTSIQLARCASVTC